MTIYWYMHYSKETILIGICTTVKKQWLNLPSKFFPRQDMTLEILHVVTGFGEITRVHCRNI